MYNNPLVKYAYAVATTPAGSPPPPVPAGITVGPPPSPPWYQGGTLLNNIGQGINHAITVNMDSLRGKQTCIGKDAAAGLGLGSAIGSAVPAVGTGIGACVGAVTGAVVGASSPCRPGIVIGQDPTGSAPASAEQGLSSTTTVKGGTTHSSDLFGQFFAWLEGVLGIGGK